MMLKLQEWHLQQLQMIALFYGPSICLEFTALDPTHHVHIVSLPLSCDASPAHSLNCAAACIAFVC